MDITKTKNNFLNGKISVFQYNNYYKSGIDSILLASIVKAKENFNILDLGMGAGVVALSMASRLNKVNIYGLEKEELFFNLAQENKDLNKNLLTQQQNSLNLILGNLLSKNLNIINNFDIVVCNPPYFKINSTHSSSNNAKGRDFANIELDATLKDFINFSFSHLKHGGQLVLINKAERLKETIDLLNNKHFGKIIIYPIYSFINKPATRFIISATKSSKAPSVLHFGIIMHNEDKSYSDHANNILQKGLDFFTIN